MSDLEGTDARIISFPDDDEVRLRRLSAAVRGAMGIDLPLAADRTDFRMIIDEWASIELICNVPGYRFVLNLREGEQVPLVTDDAGMMADFVRQYLIARLEERIADD